MKLAVMGNRLGTNSVFALLTTFIFLFFFAAIQGCVDPTSANRSESELSPSASGSGASLELSLGSSGRTVRPSDSSAYTIARYSISGSGPNGGAFTGDFSPQGIFSKEGLEPGVWGVFIGGFNSADHLIASTTLSLTLIEGAATKSGVTLNRERGDGTIDITVQWPISGEFDSAEYRLTRIGGESASGSLTLGATNLRFLRTEASGDYLLFLELKKSGILRETLTEAIQVYEGYSSVKTFARGYSYAGEFAYSPTNPVFDLNFGGASSGVFLIRGAIGKSIFLVKSNTSTAVAAAADTGAAHSRDIVVSYAASLSGKDEAYEAVSDRPAFFEDNPRATAFNANPPPIPESSIAARDLAGSVASVGYGPKNEALTVGTSKKNFWVEDKYGAWIQIAATLRAAGEYCYVWIADANFGDASWTGTDNRLTTAQANAYRDKFDGTAAAAWKDGIFKNVTSIFGFEYGGGSGGDGGKDGDQHISMLFYDIDYDYASTQSGGVLGYFWSKDYYSQAYLDAYSWGVKSNDAEIFYLDAYFADKKPIDIFSTLAHEYQHMINFNQKNVKRSRNASTWYDEMCAMVASDLTLANIGIDPALYGPAATRFEEFNYHYAESGVTDWLSPGTLKSYAGAFGFGAYLARNYGGAIFFKNLLASDSVDIASVTDALSAGGYAESFETVFREYGQALVFGDIPSNSSAKTLKKSQESVIGDIRYTASPVDLAAIRQYDLDNKRYISGGYGPRIFEPTSAVALRPYGLSIHSASAWTNLAGDLEIALEAPTDPNVTFHLMVK